MKYPTITLVCVDSIVPHMGVKALQKSRPCDFGAAKFLSHFKPENISSDIEFVQIPRITSVAEYSLFVLLELYKHVSTTHCLTVQADGWIINPDLWEESWLEFDYIGAPWPDWKHLKGHRVGNSGFCLRSKRLLEDTGTMGIEKLKEYWLWPYRSIADDLLVCCSEYRKGYKFPDIPTAARFSRESPIPEMPFDINKCFGFHGKAVRETRELCRSLKSFAPVSS